MNVRVHYDIDEVKVYVEDVLHFHYRKADYWGMQAYHEFKYTIEIYLADRTLTLEYDNRDLWKAVLNKLGDAV